MAFITNIGIAQKVLNFIKYIVPKTIYAAISDILHPCCDVSILSVEKTCVSTGVYTFVITLSKNVSLLGKGKYLIKTNSNLVLGSGNFTDGNTITISSVTLSAAQANAITSLSGYLFLPTNSDGTVGVFYLLPAFTTTVTVCS